MWHRVLMMIIQVKDYIVGFDELGGEDDFDSEILEWRLGTAGVVDYTGTYCVCVCVCICVLLCFCVRFSKWWGNENIIVAIVILS